MPIFYHCTFINCNSSQCWQNTQYFQYLSTLLVPHWNSATSTSSCRTVIVEVILVSTQGCSDRICRHVSASAVAAPHTFSPWTQSELQLSDQTSSHFIWKGGMGTFQCKLSSLESRNLPPQIRTVFTCIVTTPHVKAGFLFTRINKQLLGRFYSYCCSLERPDDQLPCFG